MGGFKVKNELLAMQLDFVVFALEKGVTTLPTGETVAEMLTRIAEALREEETPRRGRRKKTTEPEAAG